MENYLVNKNVRLRCKKYYPDAHNHIIIGRVIEENKRYLVVKGKTFHYYRIVDNMRSQIRCGDELVRIIPWDNIEIIHWISEKANWNNDITFDTNGNLILDDRARTIVAVKNDNEE